MTEHQANAQLARAADERARWAAVLSKPAPRRNPYPQPAARLFPLFSFIARSRVIGIRAVAEQMSNAGRPLRDALIVARHA